MAYNNYFPATYQPVFNPYMQQAQQQMQNLQQAQQQQIQNNGFVSVRSEEEARNYPVAPGNSVTFRNETAPYVYTKTMGFSQLDRPVFDKYRLVKEEDYKPETPQNTAATEQGMDLSIYALKSDLTALQAEIDKLKGDICNNSAKTPKTDAKKKGDNNE